jgi:hypothetical protein
MPQVFRIGSYLVYFWANEGEPLEAIHVHITDGVPTAGTTKIWITKAGKCLLANNSSKIPEHTLRDLMDVIEARSSDVVAKWIEYHSEVSYYC